MKWIGSYYRVIGFLPEVKSSVWSLGYLSLLLTRKWLCHINQFFLSITLHQIGLMEFYLALATT
jgi:hypothetical protein